MFNVLYRAADAVRRRIHRDNLGRIGEDIAHRFLRRRGCIVVARNYRPRTGHGEIDLVACQGSTVVFVEVKTRATDEFGAPSRAVDQEKQQAVMRAAREFARRKGVHWSKTRFDIVSVVVANPVRIDWHRDAFR